MRNRVLFLLFAVCAVFSVWTGCTDQTVSSEEKILVCGDHFVYIVDATRSTADSAVILWEWNAHEAMDLPESMRARNFNSIDDCKVFDNGNRMMISSSSGAVTILDIDSKQVQFYAEVPNAHSIEILPGNRLAAAASTHQMGNKLLVFDIENKDLLFEDSLYSAHGVVWDPKRNGLYALGYDVLRFYTDQDNGQMNLDREWAIPGESGHDLSLTPDGNHLLLTEHTGAWIFDIERESFGKIDGFPDAENIKSLVLNSKGQYVYTEPEESWWTYHVSFHNPAQKIPFPGMKVYKARWFAP